MNVCSPGVSSQTVGAASLKPAVVPMLWAVTDCQLYPGGSSPLFGAGLVWVGVGDGVGWLEGLEGLDALGVLDDVG
jgi:hypothetical protein